MNDPTRAAPFATPVFLVNGPGEVYFPKGSLQTIAVGSSSAVGLTPPSGATYAVIGVEGDIVRYRDDGVDPTSGAGVQVMPNSALPYSGPLSGIKFISASNSTLQVLYYGNTQS